MVPCVFVVTGNCSNGTHALARKYFLASGAGVGIYDLLMANGVKDRFMGSAAAASGEYLSERCPGRFLGAKLRRFRVTCKYSAGYSRREKNLGMELSDYSAAVISFSSA